MVDPGMRLFFGGVRMVGKQKEAENIEKIKNKSATYDHDFGYTSRTKQLQKWTTAQQAIESDRPADQTWNDHLKF